MPVLPCMQQFKCPLQKPCMHGRSPLLAFSQPLPPGRELAIMGTCSFSGVAGVAKGFSLLRAGFFANADADAKARGEKPAKPRSKDEQFTDFMTSIAADMKEAQAHDEEEAADEAAERAERELFEQRCAALTLHCASVSRREAVQ